MADTQTIIAAFTEMAAHYEQTVDRELRQFWGIGYAEFISQLLTRIDLSKAAFVLDVATGRGVIPRSLQSQPGWKGRVVGLDITPEMLTGASLEVTLQEGSDRILLVCGSGMQLPMRDATFDTVICALATHHMRVPTLLSELRRVAAPGAQVLLADVAMAPFWQSRLGKLWLHAIIQWYGWTRGGARVRAEADAVDDMLGPEQWQAALLGTGFGDVNMTVLPARKRWYPSGVLISATAL
jgi:ubiquinone/menaquinone biosynthesis C-methylase UbiE